ncbi:amino acid ABC transporter substrate-binding protein [filamentous cyanobacterium LEGE 11480]|uniref:Amino acid ABC transporter substrate-binding protein n=1 Tax=Romeriopsis navalis LEGE 11480 TaxID=2777977 RepID=A0A928VSY4_9CYAN|nr:amino acid ABC transporter substrate-binding protein [Romeriopsis navalis]MBE9031972.1 amino acid ABC transporter substrate-binding protein [Romeriopsis navalis LEGE 11480]
MRQSPARLFLFALLTILTGAIAACGDTADSGSGGKVQGKLAAVMARGELSCGVSGELPGFSFVAKNGKYSGLDVDICRAIAAALFDNPDQVDYRNLNAKERFTAVQTGEIDLLSRNTTWSLSRDTSVGMEFAPVVFYDSQALMVKQNGPIKKLEDLKNKSICIQIGTTTEQNLTDQMRKRNIPFKPLVFEDVNTVFGTYAEGRCEAVTSDRSQLISRRIKLPKPAEHTILDEALSKEPLAPAVADGDSQWQDVVKWVIYALIEAEELGITSSNLEQQLQSNDPNIKRFLGVEGTLGKDMGLTNDFAARIIKHVGNYGEIYEQNLGPKTQLNLPRGQNRLWKDGGLMYAPPLR